jgi:hypothetical protein
MHDGRGHARAVMFMFIHLVKVQQCKIGQFWACHAWPPCCIPFSPFCGADSIQLQAEEEPDARLQSLLAAIEEEEAAASADSSTPCSPCPSYKLLPKVRYHLANSAPGDSKTAADRLAHHNNLSGPSPTVCNSPAG